MVDSTVVHHSEGKLSLSLWWSVTLWGYPLTLFCCGTKLPQSPQCRLNWGSWHFPVISCTSPSWTTCSCPLSHPSFPSSLFLHPLNGFQMLPLLSDCGVVLWTVEWGIVKHAYLAIIQSKLCVCLCVCTWVQGTTFNELFS